MTIKDRIIKFWYSLPRFSFSLKKYNLDEREFKWHLQRRVYGFDERELWNLAGNFDDLVRRNYGFPEDKENFLSNEVYNDLFKRTEFHKEAKWLYERVYYYWENNCPFSKYDESKKRFINEAEKRIVFSKIILMLGHKSKGGNLVDAEINYLLKYFGAFGW